MKFLGDKCKFKSSNKLVKLLWQTDEAESVVISERSFELEITSLTVEDLGDEAPVFSGFDEGHHHTSPSRGHEETGAELFGQSCPD